MATTAAAKQALISGDWRETKDPQGKLYYFNRKLNKTVWDLDKELGASTSAATPSATTTTSAAAGASQPPTTGLPSTVSFETMAKDLVSKGVWSAKTSAVGGSAFFQHNETGETTRDLALYLEITSAVNSDKPRGSHFGGNSVTCADISGGGAPQELRSKNGTLLDRNELIGDVDPWVTLFLARDRGGEYEIASRKLLQQILERTGQWDSWNRAERRSEELQREVTAVKVQLKAKDETIAEQARELEDLRRML
ncbi:Hypothetical protein, putative [Bodo saltans]|uniref:WW domain-containing protein n=1 Tax=Bodo saltans TaxID=75058 RepID=A0A0S4JBJ1_BODSA|nr:Hypothetical protein, putative [Bodo saltans]|eukprot:CUG87456.1 Hypothetical protein, putative [Bodo saltans]